MSNEAWAVRTCILAVRAIELEEAADLGTELLEVPAPATRGPAGRPAPAMRISPDVPAAAIRY